MSSEHRLERIHQICGGELEQDVSSPAPMEKLRKLIEQERASDLSVEFVFLSIFLEREMSRLCIAHLLHGSTSDEVSEVLERLHDQLDRFLNRKPYFVGDVLLLMAEVLRLQLR